MLNISGVGRLELKVQFFMNYIVICTFDIFEYYIFGLICISYTVSGTIQYPQMIIICTGSRLAINLARDVF